MFCLNLLFGVWRKAIFLISDNRVSIVIFSNIIVWKFIARFLPEISGIIKNTVFGSRTNNFYIDIKITICNFLFYIGIPVMINIITTEHVVTAQNNLKEKDHPAQSAIENILCFV